MNKALEGLKRGYVLARNAIKPPKAKLAALELGKVLSQRKQFKDRLIILLSELNECNEKPRATMDTLLPIVAAKNAGKSPEEIVELCRNIVSTCRDPEEVKALQRAIKKSRATGRRISTDRSGKLFTPVFSPGLLEPKILKPEVSDARSHEEIKARYGETIFHYGKWKETPDGELYMKAFDIADDVREAVLRIAGDFDVHFISSHYTFGSEGHFIDRFTPPAHMNPKEFGFGGYIGRAYVSFADDLNTLVDASRNVL